MLLNVCFSSSFSWINRLHASSGRRIWGTMGWFTLMVASVWPQCDLSLTYRFNSSDSSQSAEVSESNVSLLRRDALFKVHIYRRRYLLASKVIKFFISSCSFWTKQAQNLVHQLDKINNRFSELRAWKCLYEVSTWWYRGPKLLCIVISPYIL